MKKRFFIVQIVLAFLVCSCSENAFEDILFRTMNDPFDDTPSADSLIKEHTVYLSWKEDKGADCFMLMRAADNANVLSFECIYAGLELSYVDSDMTDGERYIYRLDKKRGEITFTGKNYAFGYSSDCRKDVYENNDTEDKASFLEYDLICNLPCVKFLTQNKVFLDTDWFCIDIPPMRRADIIIKEAGLDQNSSSTNSNQTHLKIQVIGEESHIVNQGDAHEINNTSYETKRFYFKIIPSDTDLFTSGSYSTVIYYTVSLNQIINYTL